MDLQRINPWNWFKHEEQSQLPINKTDPSILSGSRSEYPLLSMHQEMDRWFDNALRQFGFPSLSSRLGDEVGRLVKADFRPKLDISSDEKSYQISLEAPGMKQDDMNIQLKDGVLTITGQKQEEKEEKDRHYYRVERSYGSFCRTLAVPHDVIEEEIQASMKDGVLKLTLPRREGVEEHDVKKIEIH
ncbi:Hsp20/alpha crystallin family protein [Gynuella sunshinyii]|uniref:Molecular chaperone (Small heat shock protein) n=1 Tax=Gynuella sunshinyii YC6258 TaxID=1445510 RepID=A0A0C5VGY9_9GAMM|nr:Hsp20/alpha crystallin family protein [Gynuella sunshinyii]AJQ93877.1 molecular chaperone (small heat shock protein) [Gynuella sunshinyii YC6258]